MFSSSDPFDSLAIRETSPPAQKARPMPVTTMTPMAGSVLQPRRVSIELESNSVLSAFNFSGRLKARVAIRSVTLVRIMIETNIANSRGGNGCGVKRNREPVNATQFFLHYLLDARTTLAV